MSFYPNKPETLNNKIVTKQTKYVLYPIKWGALIPISTTFTNNLDGLMKVATSTGSITLALNGTALQAIFTSGAANGNTAGWNMGLLYTRRDFNPVYRLYFAVGSSSTVRLFAGFTASTSLIANSNDPLNALEGIGLAIDTTQGNYRIFHNDASGATVSDDTGAGLNLGYNTFDLWADNTNSKFWWSFNNSAPVGVTANIPAASTSLSSQYTVTTTTGAKDAYVLNTLITSDN